MKTRILLQTLVCLVVWLVLPAFARGEEISAAEKGKIEALINHLENLKDATFVRNGSEYDSKTAAKFLRGKWDSNAEEIKTAGDFILKVATKSSTTGKPYLIRRKGEPETACADYLHAQLKKLEAEKR